MSDQDVRNIVIQEYAKCAKDPAYFMRKYCYIQHPQRGRILFNLYPFQEKVLKLFQKHSPHYNDTFGHPANSMLIRRRQKKYNTKI